MTSTVLWRTAALVVVSLVLNYPLRAEGGEVIVNPASGVLTVANEHVRVDSREGRWFVEWLDVPATLAGLTTTVTVGGATETTDAAGWTNSARSVKLSDRLGDSDGIEMVCRREDGLEVTVIARALAGKPAAVFALPVRNGSAEPVTVENIRLLSTEAGLSPGACPDPGEDLSVYVDSGSQGGTRAAPLGDGQNCAGICAIHNRVADLGMVCAFLSFEHDNVVSVSPGDDGVSLSARTTTPIELAPGETHDYDPALVSCYANPFEALERYADAVRDLNLHRSPSGRRWAGYPGTATA